MKFKQWTTKDEYVTIVKLNKKQYLVTNEATESEEIFDNLKEAKDYSKLEIELNNYAAKQLKDIKQSKQTKEGLKMNQQEQGQLKELRIKYRQLKFEIEQLQKKEKELADSKDQAVKEIIDILTKYGYSWGIK